MAVHPDTIVDQIMRRQSATIRVFLRYRMRCIGCPLGPFHSVGYACAEYGLGRERFIEDLNAVIADDPAPQDATPPKPPNLRPP